MPIDSTYKKHDIHATALEIAGTGVWEPRFTINYQEGSYAMIKVPYVVKYFTNCTEAETYALSFAKKWIDDGKPELVHTK